MIKFIYFFLNCLLKTPLYYLFSDKLFLKIRFQYLVGIKLNLNNPVTFNEKVQWLKIYDRKPIYTQMSDKYEVRKLIEHNIGKEYLIPLFGVYDSFNDIDFNKLPQEFIIKCTHDSGSIIICKDKNILNINKIKNIINKKMRTNYYHHCKEWAYKNITPRIVIEKYLTDESGNEISDYKIFCFNGEPKLIEVDTNRFTAHNRDYFSVNWEHHILTEGGIPNAPRNSIKKPTTLNNMLNIARKLSASIPHVRIDFYTINNNIYFGEFTFYDSAGINYFNPPEWNFIIGSWLKLP